MSAVRRALFALVAILAVAALLPALAPGAGKNSTTIVLSLKFPAFHGKLKSPRQACLGTRQVKMYREINGSKKQLGKDTTADNGKWSIPLGKNLPAGIYYATVAPRGKCKPDRSQKLPIV
jgi:hypothetical protein